MSERRDPVDDLLDALAQERETLWRDLWRSVAELFAALGNLWAVIAVLVVVWTVEHPPTAFVVLFFLSAGCFAADMGISVWLWWRARRRG